MSQTECWAMKENGRSVGGSPMKAGQLELIRQHGVVKCVVIFSLNTLIHSPGQVMVDRRKHEFIHPAARKGSAVFKSITHRVVLVLIPTAADHIFSASCFEWVSLNTAATYGVKRCLVRDRCTLRIIGVDL